MPVKKKPASRATRSKGASRAVSPGAAPKERPSTLTRPFVIGIGASAGGLEAISALLRRSTIDHAAFVVVQHLAPNQTSMLTELLGRASQLKVVTIEEGMKLSPDCVYVAPPNVVLALHGGIFHLLGVEAGVRPQLPIDSFWRSLADDQGQSAIGVVLSGTGTDGTFGLAAIKAAGGITFVQEPATAKFDGMPRSALESGSADFCLSPEGIADEIFRISSHAYIRQEQPAPHLQEHLGKLGGLLKRAFGIELSHYKPNTIERRIHRRMAVHRIDRVSDYLHLCQTDEKELAILHKDLLINVTRFFRDGEPFDRLKGQVFPALIEHKSDRDPLRIWTAGCSSGEEAYSIAMCLLEVLEEEQRPVKVQFFATDLDADAIQQARRGIYPPNIAADLPPEYLRRYFVKTDDGRYQVVRRLREMIVFSVQNLSSDPPFSRLDLVTCRNLLIYLQPAAQKKVLRALHYALNPGGFLLLGTSESVGEAADLFALIDRKNKLYSAKHVALPIHAVEVVGTATAKPETLQSAWVRPMISIAQLADRKILDQHAPPGVVINEQLEILYFRGRTDSYLQQPGGVATHNLLRLARPELFAPLKHAVEAVLATDEMVSIPAQFKANGSTLKPIIIIAQPMLEPESKGRCVLVLFKEPSAASAEKPESNPAPAALDAAEQGAHVLKQELALTKDYLQSTIEELERTNEDLKSANEELQSSNEELQSTNEELETSQEELQSTNEELMTLNDELQDRTKDLGGTTDNLHNILLGVDRAVIIVGLDLRVRRFTQAAERLLNLLPTDVGRSCTVLNSFLGGFGIEQLISSAIDDIATVEREVIATDQRWYLVRAVPYRTVDLTIRGAVFSIIDIDLQKRHALLTKAVEDYLSEVLSALHQPLLVVDQDLTVIAVNRTYYETFGLSPTEVVGTRLNKIGTGEWSSTELRQKIEKSFKAGAPFRDLGLTFDAGELNRRAVRVSGSRIRNVANNTALVLLSIEGEFLTQVQAGGAAK